MNGTVKAMLFSILVMAVLSVGTLSARQLRSEAKSFACGGGCDASHPCKTGCICFSPGINHRLLLHASHGSSATGQVAVACASFSVANL